MSLDLPRRDFLRGMLAVAAPSIVHVANIMPVKALLSDFDLSMESLFVADHERYSSALVQSFVETKEIYAANVFNLKNIRELLLPGLLKFRSQYEKWPEIDWSVDA